jgi:hypothetical protein
VFVFYQSRFDDVIAVAHRGDIWMDAALEEADIFNRLSSVMARFERYIFFTETVLDLRFSQTNAVRGSGSGAV